MTSRRHTDSVYLQYIWDSLECASTDGYFTFDSILNFIKTQRDSKCDSTKLKQQLGNALRDKCVAVSGSSYMKVDISMIPRSSRHDSYCFQCHLPGSVVDCPTCFRVYHETCLQRAFNADVFVAFPDEIYKEPTENTGQLPLFPCPTCRRLENTTLDKGVTITDMRQIFASALERIKSKIPWRTLSKVGYLYESDRNRYFSFKQMNTRIMTEKFRNAPLSPDGYPHRTSVLVDLDLLVHNATIIYGPKAEMTSTARHVRSLLQKELRESSLCIDCYLRSIGSKNDQKKIIEACRKPHKLLWYHHSSWSFRPCKVLHETSDGFEVICFDGRRERQFVPLPNAVQMTFTASELGLRMTPSLKRALDVAETYSENQRKFTSSFAPVEGLESENVPMASSTNAVFPQLMSPAKKAKPSSNAESKRNHKSNRIKSATQPADSSHLRVRRSTTDIVFGKSPTTSCGVSQPITANLRYRSRLASGSLSSLSADENSVLSSSCSNSNSSDSDCPPAKRPSYRSVAVPTVDSKIASSSQSSDSTTAATGASAAIISASAVSKLPPKATVTSSRRPSHFSSRRIETDSDSSVDSSPLGSLSHPTVRKSASSSISRRLSTSSSSASDDEDNGDSSSPLESNSPSMDRRMFPTNPASKNRYSWKCQRTASRNDKRLCSNHSSVVTAPSTKTVHSPADARGNVNKNISSPNNGTTALSSSSGIGSSVNGVDASPGDLVVDGHTGAVNMDPAIAKAIEDRVQRERLEALTHERDRANQRLNQLESYLKDLQEQHKKKIMTIKRQSWCACCLEKAIYHCCGPVAYCSRECQLKDWEERHCRTCLRIAENSS